MSFNMYFSHFAPSLKKRSIDYAKMRYILNKFGLQGIFCSICNQDDFWPLEILD